MNDTIILLQLTVDDNGQIRVIPDDTFYELGITHKAMEIFEKHKDILSTIASELVDELVKVLEEDQDASRSKNQE